MSSRSASTTGEGQREAKTWLFLALASVALMMFVAGFVLVMT